MGKTSKGLNIVETSTGEHLPRERKFVSKGLRAVLVNLDLETAEAFRTLAKKLGSNPTKLARSLIMKMLAEQGKTEQ